jgi:hypothetical protein
MIGVCASEPLAGCLTAGKTHLQVKNSDDDIKDQIKWKWSKGDALTQNLLGDPTQTDGYALCIYDEVLDVPELVAQAGVAPSAVLWRDKDPKGIQYKDKTGSSAGVTKVLVKTGAATKSKAQVIAKGANIDMPAPLSGDQYFNLGSVLTAQLVGPSGLCFDAVFTTPDAKKNDGVQFKASAP